jgi:hypothetical protein
MFDRGADWLKAGAVALILLFSMYVIKSILDYAAKHPEATLEGTEILTWQQQQILAAKGMLAPASDSPSIAAPLQVSTLQIEDQHR